MQNSEAAHLLGLLGGLDKFSDVQRHGAHGRFEQAGLGAEVAVLRAAAGFQGDDAFQRDIDAAVLDAHLVGEVEQFRQALVLNVEDLDEFLLIQTFAVFQGFFAGDVKDVGHVRAPFASFT